MADVTVNTGTSYQTMDGWGAVANSGTLEYIVTAENWKTAANQAFVSLGLNAIRLELHSGTEHTNSPDKYQAFLDNNEDANTGGGIALWADFVDGQRDFPVNDDGNPNNTVTANFKWAYVNKQVSDYITPIRSLLQAQGEDLTVVCTYVGPDGAGSRFQITDPDEYAELIKATWDHLDTTYSWVPDILEIANEPNLFGSITTSELSAMITAVSSRLTGAGYTKPRIYAPSHQLIEDTETYYNALTAAAKAQVDVVTYHRYVGGTGGSTASSIYSTANAAGKDTAMTEAGQFSHTELHEDLKDGKVSLWQQFALAWPASDAADGYQYFQIGAGPGYAVNDDPQTRYYKHYFRYIRAGAVMKGVTNSDGNFDGLPFANSNGTYAVVIKCATSGTINVKSLPDAEYGIRYSTASANDTALGNQTVSGGSDVSFSMPAAGVAVVYDINYLTQPSSVSTFISGDVSFGGDVIIS